MGAEPINKIVLAFIAFSKDSKSNEKSFLVGITTGFTFKKCIAFKNAGWALEERTTSGFSIPLLFLAQFLADKIDKNMLSVPPLVTLPNKLSFS